MQTLVKQINQIRKTPISSTITKRLKQFESFSNKSTKQWFSELCFCILTANSKAKTAINIQKQLKTNGFLNLPEKQISNCIKHNKHRFHNNKARFIVAARQHIDIKKKITKNEKQAREWLVKNIKGLGYKEASHFLRNIGYKNIAILDRHIINTIVEHKIIKKPKLLNKNNYLEIENKFSKIAEKTKMSLAELDLYMWYMKTGEVLK